ncbi:MAG: hypothetical protein VX899_14065 [Myxococcota bacterium]|nr:hypothetical protein [Myxococcota bacterium]
MITLADLQSAHDFSSSQAAVEQAVGQGMRSRSALLQFVGRYTSWNGFFGSGVATLAGKIGRSRRIFTDPAEPIHALADRSVLVGSFFFDAARDEFDDSSTEHRDTHRCLAQAFVAGIARSMHKRDPAELNSLLADPVWLLPLQHRVAQGYGATSPDDAPHIFRSMGYHLGSEVLADQEFSLIDNALRHSDPELVEEMESGTYNIGGREHACYHWLGIHSGHGGGVEHDHFEWAVQGVQRAFDYTPTEQHAALRQQVLLGFGDFARDHAEFFAMVVRD